MRKFTFLTFFYFLTSDILYWVQTKDNNGKINTQIKPKLFYKFDVEIHIEKFKTDRKHRISMRFVQFNTINMMIQTLPLKDFIFSSWINNHNSSHRKNNNHECSFTALIINSDITLSLSLDLLVSVSLV